MLTSSLGSTLTVPGGQMGAWDDTGGWAWAPGPPLLTFLFSQPASCDETGCQDALGLPAIDARLGSFAVSAGVGLICYEVAHHLRQRKER